MSEKLERRIVSKILKLAKCKFKFYNGICTELSFVDENEIHYGTLRNSKSDLIEIFKLINSLENLELLDLSKCCLYTLPDLYLPNLKHLDLGSNYLGKVPNFIVNLNLSYLNLGVNNLTDIPEWISGIKLETLKLHKNQICRFPKLNSSIKNLNLYSNHVNSIPNFIFNMLNLEFFSWGNLETNYISEEIGSLKNIKFLSLMPCKITKLPSSFCDLNNLCFLRLAKNSITHLPKEIGNLNSLKELTLYDNALTTVPSSFYNLNLNKLNLAKNPLTNKILNKLQTTFSHLGSIIVQNPFASS